MTQKFEETAHPIFCCSEPPLKGDLKSKKGKETIHCQSTTQTHTIIFRIGGSRTLESREYTPTLQCVRAFCDTVRIGPVLDTKTMFLAGLHSVESWYHRNRMSTIVLGYTSAAVSFNTPLRCGEDGRRTKGHKAERPMETKCIRNQVTKVNRSPLRKQRFQWKVHIPTKDHQSFRWKKDSGDLFRKQRDMCAI